MHLIKGKESGAYIKFLALFFISFCVLYYGSLFWLGAADPRGSIYWPNLTRIFNVFGWLASCIIWLAKKILWVIGYDAEILEFNRLRLGRYTVSVASVCLGYGVMSFWVAYVIANRVGFRMTILWCIAGCAVVTLINGFRVGLILLAMFKKWVFAGEYSHDFYHNSFTVVAYFFIGILIWLFVLWEKRISIRPHNLGANQAS